MNHLQVIARVIGKARQGDDMSLRILRKLMGADPSRADPHEFEVESNQILLDTIKTGPKTRREVFPKISGFSDTFLKPSLWSSWGGVLAIRNCPPLEKVFWYAAQAEIGRLETKLITDDALTRQQRAAIRRQIDAMMSDDAPCWVNWIKGTPARRLDQFDVIINKWLNEPIDWSEEKWFDPAWKGRLYSVESAKKFFNEMPEELLRYLGIEMAHFVFPSTGKKFDCALLKESVDEANRLAELLGVKFKFRQLSEESMASGQDVQGNQTENDEVSQ